MEHIRIIAPGDPGFDWLYDLSLIHISWQSFNPVLGVLEGTFELAGESIPVSYTHLDVYKRQG